MTSLTITNLTMLMTSLTVILPIQENSNFPTRKLPILHPCVYLYWSILNHFQSHYFFGHLKTDTLTTAVANSHVTYKRPFFETILLKQKLNTASIRKTLTTGEL